MSPTMTNLLLTSLLALSASALPQQQGSLSPRQAQAIRFPGDAAPEISAFVSELKNTPTAVRRFQSLFTVDRKGEALLPADQIQKQLVFDFNDAPKAGNGGTSKAANIGTFPALTDLGISTTVVRLEKCGINTPHVHPRATEFLTVVDGPGVDVGIILENGVVTTAGAPQEVAGKVGKLQGTVFPVGSIHYQFNNNCEPTTFVAVLNSEDPGTGQIAQNFLNLNGEVVSAVTGFPKSVPNVDLDAIKKNVPANLAVALGECAKRCGVEGAVHGMGL